MKPISKKILVASGILLCAILLGSIILRSILKSDSTRIKIQEALSKSLKMTVRIEKIRPHFFTRSRVDGLTASRPDGSSITAREILLAPKIFPLLKGQLVLSDIQINDARAVIVQSLYVKDPTPQPPDIKETPTGTPTAKQIERLTVQHLSVKNAFVEWVDASGKPIAQLRDINLQLNNLFTPDGSGSLDVPHGVLFNKIPFHHLSALIQNSSLQFEIPNIKASSGKGLIQGSSTIKLTNTLAIEYQLNVALKDVDLAQLTLEIPDLHSAGILNANVIISGSAGNSESVEGKGEIHLQNATLNALTPILKLGQQLQISELANLKLDKTDASFSIGQKLITISDLHFSGGPINGNLTGAIGFDHKLNLKATLLLPQTLFAGKNAQLFQSFFSPPDAQGFRSMELPVNGTIDHPSFPSLTVSNLLQGFLKK